MHTRNSCTCLPVRLAVGVMAFIICFIAYMLRANIAISMLSMVKSGENEPDYGPRYNWTNTEQSLVLGGFFVGSCVSTFPAGFLAEWYGGPLMTTIGLILSLLMTALTPIMSDWSVWALYANRIIVGVAGGVFFPALHNVVSKWAPPDEKGKFVSALLGGNLGTVFTFQLTGVVTEMYGWRMVFYGETVIILITTLLWVGLVSGTPRSHHFISEQEVQYIEQSLGTAVSKEKRVPPYQKIFSSVPFIALIILHYGNLWGLFFLLTIAPQFMKTLGFDLKSSGIYSSLPHLARFLMGFVFGWIGDCLRRRRTNPTFIRKSFCIFSHIIPGALLLAIPYIDDTYLIIGILTASLGFNGAATLTNLQNSQDLGPNFAGTLYSIINFIGMSSGMLGPLLNDLFQKYGKEYDFNPWSAMFWVGGLGYIIPVILFWFAGSAEVQKWNDIGKPNDTVNVVPESEEPPHDDTREKGEKHLQDLNTKL